MADDPLLLGQRVVAIYWRQVRTFHGHVLSQRRTGSKVRIIDATRELHAAAGAGNDSLLHSERPRFCKLQDALDAYRCCCKLNLHRISRSITACCPKLGY